MKPLERKVSLRQGEGGELGGERKETRSHVVVPLELSHDIARLDIPDEWRLVSTSRSDLGVVGGAERGVSLGRPVSRTRDSKEKEREALTGRRVAPLDPQPSVKGSNGHVHGDAINVVAVPLVDLDELAVVRVPQAHQLVVAARHAVLALGWRTSGDYNDEFDIENRILRIISKKKTNGGRRKGGREGQGKAEAEKPVLGQRVVWGK